MQQASDHTEIRDAVARLCAQFCIDRSIPFVAAEADGSHGALLRFYGDFTRPVDLSDFDSADAILGLATESERRVVVDLPAQSDRPLAAWIGELRRQSVGAMSRFDELGPSLQIRLGAERFGALEHAMQQLRFQRAVEILEGAETARQPPNL